MSDLGPVSPPVGIIVSVIPKITEITYPHTFWCKPISNFGLCYVTMFIDSSLVLAMSFQPSPLSACCWQIQPLLTIQPTVTCGYFSRQLHTKRLLIMHVSVGFADWTTSPSYRTIQQNDFTSHHSHCYATKLWRKKKDCWLFHKSWSLKKGLSILCLIERNPLNTFCWNNYLHVMPISIYN